MIDIETEREVKQLIFDLPKVTNQILDILFNTTDNLANKKFANVISCQMMIIISVMRAFSRSVKTMTGGDMRKELAQMILDMDIEMPKKEVTKQ